MSPYRENDVENRLSNLEAEQLTFQKQIENLQSVVNYEYKRRLSLQRVQALHWVVFVVVAALIFSLVIYKCESNKEKVTDHQSRIELLEMQVRGLEKTEHVHKLVECEEVQ